MLARPWALAIQMWLGQCQMGVGLPQPSQDHGRHMHTPKWINVSNSIRLPHPQRLPISTWFPIANLKEERRGTRNGHEASNPKDPAVLKILRRSKSLRRSKFTTAQWFTRTVCQTPP